MLRIIVLTLLCLVGERAFAAAGFLEDIRNGESVTVVTMGTSLTDGASWVTSMEAWLQSEAPNAGNVQVFNEGVGASSSDNPSFNLSGLDRQLPAALAHNPDVVFIEFGINDAYVPYAISQAQSIANLNTMIDAIETQNPDATVVLQTMNNPVGVHLASRPQVEAYYQGYRDVAEDRGLILIDHYPAWLELHTNDLATWNSYVPDGIHPNQAGHNAIVVPGIQSTLENVPEPGSLALLGLGGLALLRRRR